MLPTIVESVTTILTFAGIFYYIAAMWSARSFVRRRTVQLKPTEGMNGAPSAEDRVQSSELSLPLKPEEGFNGSPCNPTSENPEMGHPEFAAAVSILKPVKGLDPGMYEAFASHCRQDYSGDYEILFGVSSLRDPGEAPVVEAIRHLQAEFPERSIRLIECPEKLGPNGKMGNVVQLAREARYDHLLVNDSDIRVGPRYLERIMGEFGGNVEHRAQSAEHNSPLKPAEGLNGAPSPISKKRKEVGLVTAPYRGQTHGRPMESSRALLPTLSQTARKDGASSSVPVPARAMGRGTLGSKLEALGISTDFFPGVLVALKLDGEIRFGLGSTLAVSRQALDAIGGFAPLVDSLADDYELGHRIAQAGFAVALSREIVDTSVPSYTLAGYFAHQLRWARGIRDSRRLGYIGLIFTFGLPWAILNTIASGFAVESLALLSLSCLARVTVALAVGVGILGDRQVLRDIWLLPVRDLAALWVWLWSYAGNTVTWRGEKFTLEKGVLKKVDQGSASGGDGG